MHRDSLGSVQRIEPGAVNWMTAGRGIVHSERSPDEERPNGPRLHGIQTWVALPQTHEDCEPAFTHHPKDTIPLITMPGVYMTERFFRGKSVIEAALVQAPLQMLR